jgi:predicted transcriptional regulator
VGTEQSIFDAARLFIDTRLRGFRVIMDECVVGQINSSDILRALVTVGQEAFSQTPVHKQR